MALTLKADTNDLPAIAQWLMGGSGLPGGDISQPVSADAGAQPPENIGAGEVLPPAAPAKTKLQGLQELLNQANQPAAPVPQPDLSVGQPSAPPADLATSQAQGQAQINPTFQERHPTLLKLLSAGLTLGEGAAAGAGAPSFGEGYERATMLPIQKMLAGANMAKTRAEIANQTAQARYHTAQAGMLEGTVPVTVMGPNGPVTYNVPEGQVRSILRVGQGSQSQPKVLRNPASGMIEGVQTPDGKVLSPDDPNFPADVKAIIAKESPKTKPTTPEEDKLRTRQLEQALTDGTISDTDRQDLVSRQQEQKSQGVGAEILAQAGRPPVPAQFAKGANDPGYKAANVAWGRQVEAIKNREASASGAARGEGYNASRPVAVINPQTGEVSYMRAGDAIAGGAAPAAPGAKAMSQQQQFQEMHVAAGKARDAINNLDRDFTPTQIAKLTLAFSHEDPTVTGNEIRTIFGTQQLTPAQQDFVIWLNQLNERAMSLRNVAGMGQGSQDLRAAIQNTLPSLRSGSKQMALKQLDAFNNQVSILEKGIPKVKHPTEATSSHPLSQKYPGFVPD